MTPLLLSSYPQKDGDGSRERHLSIFIYLMVDESSGTDRSILQWLKLRSSSFESWLKVAGRVTKLFELSNKYLNEDKQPIPLSSISSSFEHSERLRNLRDLKLSMLLGRHLRLLQQLRSRISRAVKPSIDEGGSSLIAVKRKLSFDRLFIVPLNSGIFLIR